MFVLLEHQAPPPPHGPGLHWDFMIEWPGHERLATWRLGASPAEQRAVRAERISDHRRAYLDLEGDIGGGRGSVRRLDRGAARVLAFTDKRVELELSGAVLNGRYELCQQGDGWVLQPAERKL